MSLDRGQVWQMLGAPDEQLGGPNEPRTHDDYGVTWNEKWVYVGSDGKTAARVVLWHRYDLMGAFEIDASGLPLRLPLPEE
jgi:hypothetical protein